MRPVLVMAVACFRADRARALASLGLRAAGAVSGPVFAAALASLVTSARPGVALSTSLGAAALLAASLGGQIVLDELGWKVTQVLEERTAHHVDLEILTMVAGLPDLEHIERAENLDKIERIRHEGWLLSMSVPALLSLTVLLLRMGVSVALLATVHPLLLLLPVFAVPSLVAGAKAERIRLLGMEERQQHWRRVYDLQRMVVRAAPAKEVRVFGLGPELLRRHRSESDEIAAWERSHRLQGARMVSAGRAVFVLGYVGAVAFVASSVSSGRLGVRDLVLTIVLAGQVMGLLSGATNNANWVAWTMTAVRRYVWLLDYTAGRAGAREGAGEPPRRLATGIRLDNVSFRYPGTDTDVLTGVDLDLAAGTTVAVVGDNGAGKTTLVKLLSRFYEPTGGRITVDGVGLDTIDVVAWRRRMAAAFQDHARLELLAREAVGVGELMLLDDEAASLAALERAGTADLVGVLPHGMGTQLGPDWPDGVELSGGEWQKVALGRGMMRETPLLLVLDEPTAALDAETEHRLFDRYAVAAQQAAAAVGTVTVLVSHRFSTVRMADLIIVIAGGRIAERGTHEQLVGAGGVYAELYGIQARAYR
jgi:ATP-binding cassette subfamily B protein